MVMRTLTSGMAWHGMAWHGMAWHDKTQEWMKMMYGGSTVPSHTVYAKKDQKE